jgi:tetratricopeptide (TPR) repeat protein
VKGRYYWNKRTNTDIKTAISYFNQALEKDPGYAMAYSGLADAYTTLPNYGGEANDAALKAVASAQKALEFDPSLAHPHAVLGGVRMEYNWDIPGGEAEFRKAIQLDPSDATAHQWLSEGLCFIGGRAQEAIDEAIRAHQLDPLSPVIASQVAQAYLYDHQFDEAIEVYKKVIEDNPSFGRAYTEMAFAYWGARRYEDAIREWKTGAHLEADKDAADWADAMDAGFRSGGWQNAVRRGLEVLLAQRKSNPITSSYHIAAFYADIGDKDHAFQWLDVAYRDHDVEITGVRTLFAFDRLHSDPRFGALIRKIGLP